MSKSRTPRSAASLQAVTSERAARLVRLLKLVAGRAHTRISLTRRLHLDIRGFYRDLKLLRSSGIDLPLRRGRYTLSEKVDRAIARLPFPDPRLNLEEAMHLSRGRTRAHKKIKEQIAQIM